MSLQLLVPGLLWPHRDAPPGLDHLQLPALSWLLGRARVQATPSSTPEHAFTTALGLGDMGAAVLRRAGEPGAAAPQPGERWLCADPASLRFARDQMLLADASGLELGEPERLAMELALKEVLAPHGEFSLPHPQRGYLRLAAPSEAIFSALDDVAGRPVAFFLPEGDKGLRWGRIINEAQIALHELPFNQSRKSAHRPEANTLWFWGEGVAPAAAINTDVSVFAEGLLAEGCARLGGHSPRGLDQFASHADERAVALSERLDRAALFGDAEAWMAGLEALETAVFEPAMHALRKRRVSELEIIAPERHREGRHYHVTARPWAFWLKPAPLTALLDTAAP
ncbi:hypothetical protein [Niveibacterium sp. SC-1]|uniref:hypothetical protein n=1 Tax=Niveibacterium sp. SC-1 TaxID=3135646 RepID=UPI00311E95F7